MSFLVKIMSSRFTTIKTKIFPPLIFVASTTLQQLPEASQCMSRYTEQSAPLSITPSLFPLPSGTHMCQEWLACGEKQFGTKKPASPRYTFLGWRAIWINWGFVAWTECWLVNGVHPACSRSVPHFFDSSEGDLAPVLWEHKRSGRSLPLEVHSVSELTC